MKALCCSVVRISRMRKAVLSTKPAISTAKLIIPISNQRPVRQFTTIQPMLSARATAMSSAPSKPTNKTFRRRISLSTMTYRITPSRYSTGMPYPGRMLYPECRLNSQVSGCLARDLSRRWNPNVPSQTDFLEQPDLQPSEIELEASKSVSCRSGMGMMIVVPTFTKSK